MPNSLKESKLSVRKVKKTFGVKNSRERLIFHLKKGWYNELVRLNPFPKDLLEIGTNPEISSYVGLSPSWNVIQAYYSIYEYTNSMVFTNIDSLRTEQHRKSSNFFNKNLLSKLSGVKLLGIQTALAQSTQKPCSKGFAEVSMQFRCSTAYCILSF